MREINKAIKEENKRNQEEEDKYNVRDIKKMTDRTSIDKMRNDMTKGIPNIGSIPKVSMPNLPSISGL